MNKTEQHKKAMIEALEKSLGVVTTACKVVGIGRTQFYQWLKDDDEFAQEVDDIQNIALDYVESKLFENIQKGKTSEMIFYLKTKGKKRGYIERQEITGADGMPTNFQIEIIESQNE
jgi:phage antirepressor YoqD-like protein